VITRYLCWVAAAQALPAASVCDLLEAALQVGDSQAVSYICEELPGVQQLQAAEMTKLLLVSAEVRLCACAKAGCCIAVVTDRGRRMLM
jgi:hypothetical protein